MYARRVGSRVLHFDFAEELFRGNLLVVDRETGSLWSQLGGRAIRGALRGAPLEPLPSLQTTWKDWRARHPDSQVRIVPGARGRPYFYRGRGLGRLAGLLGRHDPARLGLGLLVGGDELFVPLRVLARLPDPLLVDLGGETLRIHHRADAFTAWAESAAGDPVAGILAYQDAWQRFHPRARVLESPEEEEVGPRSRSGAGPRPGRALRGGRGGSR